MSRKEEFQGLSQEKLEIFLEAERLRVIKEVPGGWLVSDHFVERLKKDEISMACLEYAIHCYKEEENGKDEGDEDRV